MVKRQILSAVAMIFVTTGASASMVAVTLINNSAGPVTLRNPRTHDWAVEFTIN